MIKVLLFISVFIVISPARIFLLGGAIDDDQADIYNAMATSTNRQPFNCTQDWDTTTCPRIAVVTSASPSTQDGNDQYQIEEDPGLLSFKGIFEKYGFSPRHITAHCDNFRTHNNQDTPEGKANLDILLQADFIFFNGGDQSRHARTWLNDDGSCSPMFCKVVERVTKDQVILGGTSAGTAIMSNPTYGGGSSFGQLYFRNSYHLAQKSVVDGEFGGSSFYDLRNGTEGLLYDQNGGQMPGFGFVSPNILVDTHFDRRSRLARMIPAMTDMNKTYGIGVDQSTAFFYNHTQGIVYGQNGVFVVDLSDAQVTADKYFEIRYARINYLTAGDKVQLTNMKVHSTKDLIKTPKYTQPTDSADVVSRYQMTKLLTHLVDQTPILNIGKSTVPEGFPSDTPTFQFLFFKDTKTKGYAKDGKYTAESVELNIYSPAMALSQY